VVSDPAFFEGIRSECGNLPPKIEFYPNLQQLMSRLQAVEKISLAFVLLAERDGSGIDAAGLRQLRLDFPQAIPIAILEKCDKQSELRLHSIGIQRIMLPPFDQIDVAHEIATATPNAPNFKRHPDLMHRGQVRMDFLIPSDLSYVLGINYEVSMLLKEFGFSQQDARINIPLACDEAITNAIIHGNKSQADKKVNIQIYLSHSRFRIRIRDQGEGFDLDGVADPREGENVHRASGRGVFLIRKIMDSVEYKEGGRVLELEKLNSNSKRNGE
jgi:serine/threonine-protein kinase RsbW